MSGRGCRGAVLLEFALVIAVLAAVATGISDAGIAFRIKHALKIAAREGARVAAVTPGLKQDDAGVLKVVEDILRASDVELDRTTSTVTPGGPTGSPVTVEVTYEYDPMFPGIGVGLNGTLVLRSSTTMRYEVAS